MVQDMEQQASVSDKRLLIPVKVNSKIVYFLVDTGASIALIDSSKAKELEFKLHTKLAGTIVGAGGLTSDAYLVRDIDIDFNGRKLYQFIATDIESVKHSIKENTGYEIFGILSLNHMKQLNMIIDTINNKVYYK